MRLVLVLCLLSTASVFANTGVALNHGEELTYRVGWGIFLHAGEIKVTARSETDDNQPCLVVTTTTSTRGFSRSDGQEPIVLCHVERISARRRCQSAASRTRVPSANTRGERKLPKLD